MNPLDYVCPSCKAPVGEKCKNYLGKGCAPHRTRGKEQEAYHDRAETKAKRLNRQHDEAYPLFAGQDHTTAEAEYWHTRVVRATMACHESERRGAGTLNLLIEAQLRRLALQHIPPAVVEELHAYRLRTYPHTAEYGMSYWREILIGRRTVARIIPGPPRQTPYGMLGTHTEEPIWPLSADWKAPYTAEELNRIIGTTPEAFQPDDQGARAALDRALDNTAKG